MTTNKYLIKAALSEEALESWVWSNDSSITSRGFIIIENTANGNKIKTFKRTIDDNYINLYNKADTNKINSQSQDSILIINEYLRNRLLIKQNESFELKITAAGFWDKLFFIHLDHPNPTVQSANRATIVSCILAIVALVLTVYSLILTLKK